MARKNIFSFFTSPFIVDLLKLYNSGKISKEKYMEYAKLAGLAIENEDGSVSMNRTVEENFPDFFV